MSGTRNRRKHSSRASRSRLTAAAVGIASIAVLGLAVTMFVRPFTRGAEAPSEATVLRISMSGWSQKVVDAPADGAIRITMVNLDNRFHSDGGGWHNFVVPSLEFEARVAPKGTETFTVELNELPPGEYEFYCDICCGGKDNPFMQGTLRVS